METIRVFGSFARGATDVGDIDLAVKINTSRDKRLHARLIRRLATGADPWSGWQTSLGARSPILEIHFENHPPEENMVLLYAAGDSLETCLQRLLALTPDQSATHAPRHWEQAKTESLRGLEQHFGFLTATLDLLVVGNALQIERVDLEDCSNDHPPRGLSSGSEQRLQGGNAKPLLAALVYLQDLGIAPAEISLLYEPALGLVDIVELVQKHVINDSTKSGSDLYPGYRCRIRDPQPEGGVMPRKNIDPEASFSF